MGTDDAEERKAKVRVPFKPAEELQFDIRVNLILGRLRKAASKNIEQAGSAALFALYDEDGSGELDPGEFLWAARQTLEIPAEEVSDEELRGLWGIIDEEFGSSRGCVDSEEFGKWLQHWKRIRQGGAISMEILDQVRRRAHALRLALVRTFIQSTRLT
eukprot:SAG31_NODE_6540_length_1982_cov_164.242167_3_plen_159_part_00